MIQQLLRRRPLVEVLNERSFEETMEIFGPDGRVKRVSNIKRVGVRERNGFTNSLTQRELELERERERERERDGFTN